MSAFPPPIVALTWESATGQVVDLQGDPQGIRVNIVEGLDELPATRDIVDIVPFRPGRLRQPSIADRRAIVLAGYVKTPGDGPYRPIVAYLQRAMDPAVGAGTLTAVLEDGGARTIEAVPQGIAYVGRIRTGKNLTIELDADPYWRSALAWGEGWTMDMGLWMDDGHLMDATTGPIELVPTTSPDSDTYSTLGTTATTDPVVEVDGPCSGAISVLNADGIGFTHPAVAADKTLVVDAGARTAVVRGRDLAESWPMAGNSPAWTSSTSAMTMGSSTDVPDGYAAPSLRESIVALAAGQSAYAVLDDVRDLSAMPADSRATVWVKASSLTDVAALRFLWVTSIGNYYQLTCTPGAVDDWQQADVAKSALTVVGSPSWASIASVWLLVTAGANPVTTTVLWRDARLQRLSSDVPVNARQALTLAVPNRHGEFFRVRPASDTFTVTGHPAAVRIIHRPTWL